MPWYFFAGISILSISFANLFQKVAMRHKDSDPVLSSIIFQFLLAAFTGIFALINGFSPPPTNLLFPYFLISSLLYAFGTLFIFKAIKAIEASELSILAAFGSLATIISAFIFLGERLTVIQFVGITAIFLAVFLVNKGKGKIKFDEGFKFALLGYTLYGFAVTNDTFILKSYNAISYTPIMSFLPGVILCLIYFSKLPKMVSTIKEKVNINLGIYSALYGVQAVTYYLSLESGALASQMSSIFKTEMILTVFLATIFLKESKNLIIKMIAMTIAILGAFLLI